MGYTIPMTEGGSPLPLSGYTIDWPIEMTMGYTVEDLIQKFGYRIQDAIRTPIYGETGLDDQIMKKKTKWWKLWNRDIREAYIWYTGKVYNEEFMGQWKSNRTDYYDKPINPNYYKTIKLGDLLQTVPPSEDFPTLAPEHHEKSTAEKIKWTIPLSSKKRKSMMKETLVMDHIETKTESSVEYLKKYHRDHSCCPNCGSNHLHIKPTIPYLVNVDHKEDYKDLNEVTCEECDYKGTRHDLVPKKRKPRLHEHTFELDGGPCLKCGKTVSEMIDEDIKNYKNGKSK